MDFIKNKVHELYWQHDVNCARSMLVCLGELFGVMIEPQTMDSAVGLHGAGGFRAQCGLVEGGLMFLGIYFKQKGKTEEEIVRLCYDYADSFSRNFGSLTCRELRPGGFDPEDPPHLCEHLTCDAVEFACDFVKTEEAAD